MAILSRVAMTVQLDGESFDVVTDQRDAAAFELQEFYRRDRPLLMQRFMAYRAAVRTGKTSLSWAKFDAACIEVTAADSPAAEAAVDPTVPAPSGAP